MHVSDSISQHQEPRTFDLSKVLKCKHRGEQHPREKWRDQTPTSELIPQLLGDNKWNWRIRTTLSGENYDQTSNILIHMGDSLFFHKKQATHGYPKIGLCSFSHTLGLITVYLTL
jgi:hypothetical protein